MNIKKFLVAFIILISFVIAFSSCGGDDYEYYDITYYVGSDIYYQSEVVGTYCRRLDFIPERFGYRFLGLYDSYDGGTQIFNENGMANVDINSPVTLYSQWEAMDYNIVFDPAGGYLADTEKEATYTYGSEITSFPVPQMENMDFIGWKNSNGMLISTGGIPNRDATVFNQSSYAFYDVCTLTACWEIKKYEITFDFADPNYQSQSCVVEYDQQFTSDLYPEKIDTGTKELVGWTTSYGSNIEWDGNLTSNITLFAIWKEYRTVTVYELIGGAPQQKRVYKGEAFYTPERGGYAFMGWYGSETMAGLPIGTISYTNVPPVIYASWQMETYSVQFVTDTGSLQTLYYTIEDTLALPTVSKQSYSFVGWCDNQELTGTPRLVIRPGSYGNLTLYPLFKGDDRTVRLDPAEGMLGLLSQTVEYGAIVNISVPSLEGFAFVGWFDEDGVQITDRQGKSLLPWFYDTEVSLTAKYAEKYYIYLTDSITGTTTQFGDYYLAGDQVLVYCDEVTGYHFDGFYSDSGRLESVTLEFYQIIPDSDVYLNLKFTPKQYTVILDSDGGVCKENQITVSYGEQVVFPTVYKEGYSFMGWRYSDWTYEGDSALTTSNGTLTNTSGRWDRDSDAILVPYFVEDTSNSTPIANGASFAGMMSNPGGSYKLVSDIDMTGITYTPFEFSGTLEGNGFTVKNLTLSTESGNFGIFTKISGTISNIVFENISIRTSSYGSAFVGGVCGELTGNLNRIIFKGTVSGQGGDSADIGGLVGKMSSGTISYCESYATVIGNSIENAGSTGGIVGFAQGGSIEGCTNYGTVTGFYRVGGITGLCYVTPSGALNNLGVVTGQNYVGGIIGFWENNASINSNAQLTNSATITGTDHVGGIIGRHTNVHDNRTNYTSTYMNFTNTGAVSGATYVGGTMGSAYIINHNYSSVAHVSGFTNTGNITGTSRVGGLFGYFHAEDGSYVKASSSKAIVTAENYVGGLCGEMYYTIFDGCTNIGSTIVATGYIINGTEYFAYVGGYAGEGYGAKNCENNVRIEYAHQAMYVGGLFGHSRGPIEGCKNSADVYAPKASLVGGITGCDGYDGNITHTNLTNTGNITATEHVGGIFGEIYNTVDARSDYTVNLSRLTNSGTIVGTNHVGGIVGYYYAVNYNYATNTVAISLTNTGNVTGTSRVGGIMGYSYADGSSTIKNSSSSATITAEYLVGCILGENNYLTVDSCSNAGSTLNAKGHHVDGTTYYAYVGGYVGHGHNVYNCTNAVNINYTGKGIYIGGIIGISYGDIKDCENSGSITANNTSHVGGICGYSGKGGSTNFSALKNTGNVSAKSNVGGIFGRMYNQTDSRSDYVATFSAFENTGAITGSEDYVGGIFGYLYLNNNNYSTRMVANTLGNSGSVKGNMYVGGVFGYAYSDNTDSTIELASSSSRIEAKAYIGGIGGKISNIVINNSSNEGSTIIATGYYLSDTVHYAFVGGYAGEGYSFNNCENNANIEYTERGMCVGGIVGACFGALTQCTNNGSITTTKASQVGGVAGYVGTGGSVTHSTLTNTGNIIGIDSVGGIIGQIYNQTDSRSDYVMALSQFSNSGNVTGAKYVAGNVGYIHSNNNNWTTVTRASFMSNTGNVTGAQYVGGCFGYVATDHSDSYIMEASSSGEITAEYYIGGIAGQLSTISLKDSSNEGTVINATGALVQDGKYYIYAGGYVGQGVSIHNCQNATDITITQEGLYVGGIAGFASGHVIDCSNTGNITAENCNYVGGIAGLHGGGGSYTIQNVANEGDISGADYVAGVFGALSNQTDTRSDFVVTFTQATNKGAITGNTYVSGIVGHMSLNNRNWTTMLKGSLLVNEGTVTGVSNVGGLMAYCATDHSSSVIVGYTSTGKISGQLSSQTIYEMSNVTISE